MVSETEQYSKRAISNGLWFVGHGRPSDPEATQVQLLTAILSELVAAREARDVPKQAKLKWPEDVPKPTEGL